MNVLILDDVPDFSRVVGQVLSGMGFGIGRYDDPFALVEHTNPGDMILAITQPTSAILPELVRALRKDASRTYTPVLVLASEQLQRDPAFVSLLGRLPNARAARRDISLLDLGQELRDLRASASRTPKPSDLMSPQVGAMLQLFGAIWCQEESGALTTGDGEAGLIVHGAPADAACMDLIEAALSGAKILRFERTHHRGAGDSSLLGRVLWAHAGRYADPNFGLSSLDLALQPVIWTDRLSDLPVSEDIPRLVRTADGQTTLRSQFIGLGLDPGKVGRHLSMLKLLGLLRLEAPTRARERTQPPADAPRRDRTLPPPDAARERTLPPPDVPRRERTLPPPDVARERTLPPPDVPRRERTLPPPDAARERTLPPPDVPRRERTLPPPDVARERAASPHDPDRERTLPPPESAPYGERTTAPARAGLPERGSRPTTQGASPLRADPNEGILMLKRLRKEVDRLARADSWTVLGIAPTPDPGVVAEAGRRLRARYEKIAADRADSDEIGRLCASLIAQVQEAMARAARRQEQSASASADDDVRLFLAGKEAAGDHRWNLATRAFRAAHRLRIDNPEYQAWLGWALFNDTARGDARLDEALELLELADSFDDRMPEPQLFLARVEMHAGRLERALARLDRLARLAPQLDGVEATRRLVRDKLNAASETGK